MSDLIEPDELTLWVPGTLTLDSAPLGWDGLRLRGYRYEPSDVAVPKLRDYAVVVYERGVTPMNRRCGGGWRTERVAPGDVSLLTHAARSHWQWTAPIEVSHMYLSPDMVAKVAAEVFERDIEDVELFDVLRAEDPALCAIARSLRREVREGGLGGRLYVDALKCQAAVHILRNYADVVFREPQVDTGLSREQRRRLLDFVEANIDRSIALAELAALVGLSLFHFVRKFRNEFGVPPHAYVLRRRLEAARRMLGRPELPLKAIAAASGFADQSHMTRLFRRMMDVTPGEYRQTLCGPRRPSGGIAPIPEDRDRIVEDRSEN